MKSIHSSPCEKHGFWLCKANLVYLLLILRFSEAWSSQKTNHLYLWIPFESTFFFTEEKPKRLTFCMCEFHLNQHYFFYRRKSTDLTNFSHWKDQYSCEQNAIHWHISKFDGTVSSGIWLMLNISFLRCWWTVQSTMTSVIQYDITWRLYSLGKCGWPNWGTNQKTNTYLYSDLVLQKSLLYI